jgi:hypothetical protein
MTASCQKRPSSGAVTVWAAALLIVKRWGPPLPFLAFVDARAGRLPYRIWIAVRADA